MMLSGIQAVAMPLIAEFQFSREIEDRLLAPMEIEWLAVEKVVAGTIQALAAGEMPLTALWPLIRSWTLACQVLDPQQTGPWQAACAQLGLLGNEFEQRVSDLDGFLDQIEVRLDEVAVSSGVETSRNR